jgi:polyhydroxybutyrate depolymerase
MPIPAPRRRAARATLLAGAFALLAGVAACGQGGVGDALPDITYATAPLAVPGAEQGRASTHSATQSAGTCQTTGLAAGLTSHYIDSAGLRRTVLVYYPHGHRGGKPVPMVVDLHGSGDTPLEQIQGTGIAVTADKHDFAVVAPQGGVPFTLGKSHGYAWNIPGVALANGQQAGKNAPDDVRFLRDTIAAAAKLVCADSQRIYVTGFSGGARMTSQLGCAMSDRIAAIAPVSGLRFPAGCRPTRPVPVISFHGTADAMNPYNGGKSAYWGYSVQTAAERWAVADRCAKNPVQGQAAAAGTTTYRGCGDAAGVTLYTIPGGRHTWPAPKVNADELIWAFFAAHPLGSAA